jgi:hypothetical protein
MSDWQDAMLQDKRFFASGLRRFLLAIEVDSSGCWNWKKCLSTTGYGKMRFRAPLNSEKAHRISYVLHSRERIPFGMGVLHACDNPKCVSPFHLFLGSQLDNARDAMAKGRASKPPRFQGEQQAKAKLTASKVEKIRKEYAAGKVTYVSLARKYGLTPTALRHAAIGKTWKHIPTPPIISALSALRQANKQQQEN